MKVKATQRGFWPNGTERNPGDEFDYDGPTSKEVSGKKVAYFPSWMEKVEAEKPQKTGE